MAYTKNEFSSDAAKALFARRLNILLHNRQVTRREVADYVGVQETTIGRWALGKAMPRYAEQLDKLTEFFKVSKPYFLEENFEDAAKAQKFVATTFRERSLLMAYRAAPEDGKKKIEDVAGQYLLPFGI